jgi:hypothetical protein
VAFDSSLSRGGLWIGPKSAADGVAVAVAVNGFVEVNAVGGSQAASGLVFDRWLLADLARSQSHPVHGSESVLAHNPGILGMDGNLILKPDQNLSEATESQRSHSIASKSACRHRHLCLMTLQFQRSTHRSKMLSSHLRPHPT